MADLYLTLVVTMAIFSVAGYLYAKKFDRDPVRWAIAGALFNVLILAVFIVVGGRSAKAKQYVR